MKWNVSWQQKDMNYQIRIAVWINLEVVMLGEKVRHKGPHSI